VGYPQQTQDIWSTHDIDKIYIGEFFFKAAKVNN
jgi:hypothetical protein